MLAALLSGFLLALSFPNPAFKDLDGRTAWLAWLALIPLFLALKNSSPRRALILGFACGLVFFGGSLYWIAGVHRLGHLAFGYWALSSTILALTLGAAAALTAWGLARRLPGPVLWVPALWTLTEALRCAWPIHFDWLGPGASQFRNPWVLPLAAVAGIHAIHFAVLAVNWQLAEACARPSSWSPWARQGAILLALFMMLRQAAPIPPETGAASVKVALLQGGIEPGQGWGPEQRARVMTAYLGLMQQAVAQGAQLLIWPETSFPSYFEDHGPEAQTLANFSRQHNVEVVIGSNARDSQGYANAAVLLQPDGATQEYRKALLVPWCERVPALARHLPFFDPRASGISRLDCVPGNGPKVLRAHAGTLAPLICYEANFPSLARQGVQEGGQVLIQLTSDDWGQDSAQAYQHLIQNVFRSVEEGRWLARVALTGVSCFVGPDGRIWDAVPLHQAGLAVRELPLLDQRTPYQRWGDWFLGACLGILVAAFSRRPSVGI